MRGTRPLIFRILLPSVPWWAALTCNILAAIALMLLALDSHGNLLAAAMILGIATVALYGTALVAWVRKR